MCGNLDKLERTESSIMRSSGAKAFTVAVASPASVQECQKLKTTLTLGITLTITCETNLDPSHNPNPATIGRWYLTRPQHTHTMADQWSVVWCYRYEARTFSAAKNTGPRSPKASLVWGSQTSLTLPITNPNRAGVGCSKPAVYRPLHRGPN